LGVYLFEETVDRKRLLDVYGVHYAQHISVDPVPLEKVITPHNLLEGGSVIFGFPEMVMQFPWTINADPDSESLFG